MTDTVVRHDWTGEQVREVYDRPFPELIFTAQSVHRQFHDPTEVQQCTLLSVKTGGCPEDCAYCPQSARYDTGLARAELLDVNEVLEAARVARRHGSTRFCMGAAWRSPPEGRQFEQVLEMVRGVRALQMEACCTLGMLTGSQATRLKDAGLTAYNHNLDTGPEFYKEIITTRSYEDRLETLRHVRDAGITVCCGGIIGMGETIADRLDMLTVLAGMDLHPESVPINALVRVEGTPLAGREGVDPIDFVRTIATARILMPPSRVRLSAGRTDMSIEMQALCFVAGANSIFTGERLLTTPNPNVESDTSMFERLGMRAMNAE